MSQLRQIILAVHNYEETIDQLIYLLDSYVVYSDQLLISKFGLKNAFIPVGNGTFLQVVSPISGRESDVSNFIEKRGDGGYMIIIQTANINTYKKAKEFARDLRVVNTISRNAQLENCEYSITGPGFNTPGIAGFHIHPSDTGTLAQISIQNPRSKWFWAGNDWLQADNRTRIAHGPCEGLAGVEIHIPEDTFDSTVGNWKSLIEVQTSNEPQCGLCEIILGNDSVLRFVKSKTKHGLKKVFIYSTKMPHGASQILSGLEICFVHPLGDMISKL